ncbi:MAG: family 1 glycosylhydrolase [Candidatus Marinimicrobia bacterium]|nr:family 1 glycosylhydrolase [Candidatus Neomarinimicrobiota bacterium]
MTTLAVTFLIGWVVVVTYLSQTNPDVKWQWDSINTSDIHFPSNFAWGTATAAHQVEGNNTNNNWYEWERSVDDGGISRIHNNDRSGLAADHWNRYPEDIILMKDLGVSHYRFSVEWSRIEPEKGRYDLEALAHYRRICKALVEADITPVVTLHHFTHPTWFEEMGAFEKEENTDHFVGFSELVFNELRDLVPMWCTFNEPSVFVAQGYFNGIFPPGKKDPILAGTVLENMLNAHVRTYHQLKSIPGSDGNKIGLVKNIFQFDPYRRWHVLDWAFSKILNDVYTNAPLEFLKTGESSFYMPGMVDNKMSNELAVGTLDFIGLNYYSRMHVKGQLNAVEPFVFDTREQDIMTDMGYPLYAEGFHRALKTISRMDVPIYVTENGLADDGDSVRPLFIKRYLYALNQALRERIDVRGYFYWSLMDNFEWAEGYSMKFGLYEVDLETQDRRLREGSRPFVEMVNKRGADERGYLVNVGEMAPDLTMEYVTGETVRLQDLRGKVVVLQFTASWCSVCRQEMPHLEKDVWQAYKDKGVVLIGVDRDEPLETVLKFQDDIGTTYPLALDPGANIFGLFADKNAGVTRNVVIDQDGRIVFLTRLFEEKEYQEMLKKIGSLL